MKNYMYSKNNFDSTDDESTVSSSNRIYCRDTYNQHTGQTQRRCFTRDKNRQLKQRQGHQQRQYRQVSTDDKAESTVSSKLLSVLLSVLFLFFLVYTLRLYYYNIEDLSEEDFEQRQKNISTMIQMMIGVIILIIGLYFIVSSKP
jgi:hypothetical protein